MSAAPAPIVFMFCGQGSQHFQMGRALFDGNAVFRDVMQQLDGRVNRLIGCSLVELLYGSEANRLRPFVRTLHTNPAIFCVQYALAQTLLAAHVRPALTLGVSLGTFTAAVIAGHLSVQDALELVIEEAEIFESCCEPGGMLAVLGRAAEFESLLGGDAELAAVSSERHCVVAAPEPALAVLEARLRASDFDTLRMPVSFAFHSRWIDPAKSPIETAVGARCIGTATLPLVCAALTREVEEFSAAYCWHVARAPIRFTETVAALERRGAHHYVDVGPSGTLGGIMKYVLAQDSRSRVATVLSPYDRDLVNLAQLTSELGRVSPFQ